MLNIIRTLLLLYSVLALTAARPQDQDSSINDKDDVSTGCLCVPYYFCDADYVIDRTKIRNFKGQEDAIYNRAGKHDACGRSIELCCKMPKNFKNSELAPMGQ